MVEATQIDVRSSFRGGGSVVEQLHVRVDISLGGVCRITAIILVGGD